MTPSFSASSCPCSKLKASSPLDENPAKILKVWLEVSSKINLKIFSADERDSKKDWSNKITQASTSSHKKEMKNLHLSFKPSDFLRITNSGNLVSGYFIEKSSISFEGFLV